MITPELEDNINFTHTDARRRRLDAVTLEHLVMVLMDDSSVRRCLSRCGADVEKLRRDLECCIESQARRADGGRPAPTAEFERVIARAVRQTRARDSGGGASGAHVLAAVFAEPDSRAAYYLCKHGVERLAVLAFAHYKSPSPAPAIPAARPATESPGTENDLVAAAAAGRLEEPFGRDSEVAEIVRVLGRKYKNNPVLVGEPGVGKTAIVHKLAHCALRKDAPAALSRLSLLSVSMGDMVAGTKYRGDFEQRMRRLLEKCRAQPNTVLFLDEIHTVVGAGAVSGGALDAANLMKPLLTSGVRCIGATTCAEYRRLFERDAALSRRFHKIDAAEPSGEELQAILSGVIARLSAHHGVEYAPQAAEAATRYSARFLPSRFLPDKAIDLLDDAGSQKHINKNATSDSPIVSESDIVAAARNAAGLPPDGDVAGLEKHLSSQVVEQPQAAAHLAAAVLRRRFGYHDNGRTAGAFLFAGPTGTGKTEMARQLAAALGAKLLRFDMSEYMEAHSVSRLIGAPPGYVGFEQSGGLTEGVFRHPDAVLLLDEIEKAHPDILHIFLQVMDYGVLRDNAGRDADFSNTILIMTSNVGAEEWSRPPAGFGREKTAAAGAEALSRRFSPEFRNRLDAMIRFEFLSRDAIARIVDLRLRELNKRLRADKNISIRAGKRLRDSLARDGFSAETGARAVERLLRARIVDSLAAAESEGRIAAGGKYIAEEDRAGKIAIRPDRNRKIH